MTRPIARDPINRRRRFDAGIIELFVRWYITYRLGSVAFADNSPNSTSEALGLALASDEKCHEIRHL
jgi:hypothetical protein